MEGLYEQSVKWEKSNEYLKAVDSYLKIAPTSTIDKEKATKCWLKVTN